MEMSLRESKSKKEEEDYSHARLQIWNYIFDFVGTAVVKCAIELKVADAIESHGSPMTLQQLASALNCSPPPLQRIMRFLVHRGIFKEEPTGYAQTPLSRLLASGCEMSMAPFLLLENSPPFHATWHCLSEYVKNGKISPFEAAHGEDVWSYTAANPEFGTLFNEAMGCSARVLTVPAILEGCREIFDGIGSLVDVGGGKGTALSIIVKSCPWIQGINFDLPHVVAVSPEYEGVRHVGGDMFDCVPTADAAFLMFRLPIHSSTSCVLHDWNQEECIRILKNCKQAIPENIGKVIIVEAVIDEKEEGELSDLGMMFDMVMMAHTNKGKERTAEEWGHVLKEAGFTRYTITPIRAVQSVIQGFP